MSTIAERIMEIVNKNGGNKSEFARRINVTPAYISKLGKDPNRVPSDRTITDICREFNISEVWLRTGEGEPKLKQDEDEEFLEIMERIHMSDDDLIKRIIKAYWFMSDDEKAVIRKLIDGFSKKITAPNIRGRYS